MRALVLFGALLGSAQVASARSQAEPDLSPSLRDTVAAVDRAVDPVIGPVIADLAATVGPDEPGLPAIRPVCGTAVAAAMAPRPVEDMTIASMLSTPGAVYGAALVALGTLLLMLYLPACTTRRR
jgi:hypothetical protein